MVPRWVSVPGSGSVVNESAKPASGSCATAGAPTVARLRAERAIVRAIRRHRTMLAPEAAAIAEPSPALCAVPGRAPVSQTLPVRIVNFVSDRIDLTVAAVSALVIAVTLILVLLLNLLGTLRDVGKCGKLVAWT